MAGTEPEKQQAQDPFKAVAKNKLSNAVDAGMDKVARGTKISMSFSEWFMLKPLRNGCGLAAFVSVILALGTIASVTYRSFKESEFKNSADGQLLEAAQSDPLSDPVRLEELTSEIEALGERDVAVLQFSGNSQAGFGNICQIGLGELGCQSVSTRVSQDDLLKWSQGECVVRVKNRYCPVRKVMGVVAMPKDTDQEAVRQVVRLRLYE